MAGANANSSNRFGLTPFIVGQQLGNGCNYAGGAGIQQAINDCAAAGGGVVGIRSSTVPYVVDLSFIGNVDLLAFHADGRLPAGLNHVSIEGKHTWSPSSGAVEEIVVCNIAWSDPAFGDVFTISPTGGTTALFASKFCSTISNSGAGAGKCFVLNPDVTSFALVVKESGQTDAGQIAFDCIGAGTQQVQIQAGSDINATSASCVRFMAGTCSTSIDKSVVTAGTFGVDDQTGAGQVASIFSTINGISAVSFTAPGGSFTSLHCTLDSSGANYVAGTGTFTHAGSILPTAITLPGTVTEVKVNSQPYASAGTSVTAYRGAAGFDSTQFSTSADGFVQFATSPFLLPGFQIVNTTPYVATATDYYMSVDTSTFAITIQLPDAPATKRVFIIKDSAGQAATRNISVTTVSGVKFLDAGTTYTMATNYQAAQFAYNGVNYEVF